METRQRAFEVGYTQETYDPDQDYSRVFYFWSKTNDSILHSSSWTFLPAYKPAIAWLAVRIRNGQIQVLSIESLEDDPARRLDPEDPLVPLFRRLMELEPLESEEREIDLRCGLTDRADERYVRFSGPPAGLSPRTSPEFLNGLLSASSVAIEPADDAGFGEWWVATFGGLNQASWQGAYERLVVLDDMLVEFGNQISDLAENFFQSRLETVREMGWSNAFDDLMRELKQLYQGA